MPTCDYCKETDVHAVGCIHRPPQAVLTVESEANRVMAVIEESELASSRVPRETSIDFYDELIDRLTSHRDLMRDELEDENE